MVANNTGKAVCVFNGVFKGLCVHIDKTPLCALVLGLETGIHRSAD